MRVLIFGSRTWDDSAEIMKIIDGMAEGDVLINGNTSGADWIAQQWARARGLGIETFKPNWGRFGKAAGPLRNQDILDSGVDVAYGFRKGSVSKGTDDMVQRLKAAGVPVTLTVKD